MGAPPLSGARGGRAPGRPPSCASESTLSILASLYQIYTTVSLFFILVLVIFTSFLSFFYVNFCYQAFLSCFLDIYDLTLHVKIEFPDLQWYPCNLYLIRNMKETVCFLTRYQTSQSLPRVCKKVNSFLRHCSPTFKLLKK